MTPATFLKIRKGAGLTQGQLSRILRLADSRAIRRYEAGDRAISGPISLLMEMVEDGRLKVKDDE